MRSAGSAMKSDALCLAFAALAVPFGRPAPRNAPLQHRPPPQPQHNATAAHGADVILGVRNVEAGKKIAKEIMWVLTSGGGAGRVLF